MTSAPSGSAALPPSGTDTGHRPDRRLLFTAVLAGLLGLVAGGLIVALTGIGSTTEVASPAESPAARPSTVVTPGSPSPSESPALTVGASCLRAAQTAQQVAQMVQDTAAAVRNLDAQRLDALVNAFRMLEPQLQEQLRTCQASVQLPLTATPSPPLASVPVLPTPTDQASGSGPTAPPTG